MEKILNTNNGLIYNVEDRPSFKDALFAAFQHLLAIIVALITPPLIISKAIGLDIATTSFLVSMSFCISGFATFIQCKRMGHVGCGLLCVQGTSFSFIGPIIAIAAVGGLPLVFGAIIMGAPIEIVVSYTFKYLRKVITPLVSGIVVMLIGLTLIKAGITACGGGNADAADFGSLQNLGISVMVMAFVVFFNNCRNHYLRMSSILLSVVIGYVVSFALGMVDFSELGNTANSTVNIPVPFKMGVDFSFSAFLSIALIYLVTAIEATGDITANSLISGQSIEGESYVKRVSGGILSDGLSSLVAGIFCSFPISIFAQNNGIIQLTGVASRRVGYYISGMLILLSIFPVVGMAFSLMPSPVLGGATLLMFGTVAAAGIRIISSQKLTNPDLLVLAVSLALGMGVELMPQILNHLPDSIRTIFASGITTGGVTAIALNTILKFFNKQHHSKTVTHIKIK